MTNTGPRVRPRSRRAHGWAPHSKVLAGYLEVVDQWGDNALLGVL
ncbi:hypothetical protein [Streptomyces sp. NBC_01618]|nr:hypothetical protein OH735_07065 [Streptomyces sp. NBC_01618]